jgi:hypothetical protein
MSASTRLAEDREMNLNEGRQHENPDRPRAPRAEVFQFGFEEYGG